MIQLFNIPNHSVNTKDYSHYLHGKNVSEFEEKFASYVGAKYAIGLNSATTAIFLILNQYKDVTINVPSMIPPVVLNAILTSGNKVNFVDNVDWVGGAYTLHEFPTYKVIDSAQQVDRNQFSDMANDNDLMFFSFYPTKPVGSSDGGIVVSNDKNKIDWLRTLAYNGMSTESNNWDRKIIIPGYKMYMNSIQADIASKNLSLLDRKQEKLATIRTMYNNAFGLNNTSSHLYRILVDNRKQFIEQMKENHIVCGIHYQTMHDLDVYNFSKVFNCPKSDYESKHTVTIPFHENLTMDEVKYVINSVNKFGFNK